MGSLWMRLMPGADPNECSTALVVGTIVQLCGIGLRKIKP